MKHTDLHALGTRTGSASHGAAWIFAAPLSALAATFVLILSGAGPVWFGAVWLAAVLWTVAASLVQALWAGLRHGDWSTFTCDGMPYDNDDHDYATRSGAFAHLRVRAAHEALIRDGDRFLADHDQPGSRA